MFYEIKLTRDGLDDHGRQKKFTELYLIEAPFIFDAIQRFEVWIASLFPEHESLSVKRVNYEEVIPTTASDYRFYKVKYNTVMLDERSAREKKKSSIVIIQADNIDSAKAMYEKTMCSSIADTELEAIEETKIVDFISTAIAR